MILEAIDCEYRYPKSDTRVFEEISFSVKPSEVICILGPNGVGKTTLLQCLTGLNHVTRGKILCRGKNLSQMGRREIAQTMAFIPQSHEPVFAYSVMDVVLMGRTPHIGFFSSPSAKDKTLARDALEELDIAHLAAKAYTEISGGERQLVLFARVLAQNPQLIVLDEPTSHLDYGNKVKILNRIKKLAERGIAVVMTSHDPDHSFLISDRVALMNGGKFEQIGVPDAVITEEALRSIYGIEVRIKYFPDYGTICLPIMPGL